MVSLNLLSMVDVKTMELQCVNYTNEMVQCLHVYVYGRADVTAQCYCK